MSDGINTLGTLEDPPLHVTNHHDAAVRLAWQTTIPGERLSPWRETTIAAGTIDEIIVPGMFWIIHEGLNRVLVDNVVFISVVDPDGGFGEQVVVHAEIFADHDSIDHIGLAVTIDADGYLSAAPIPVP
jgi:hypothetical protein